MYYFYILVSKKDKKLYLGSTKDLQNRFKLHIDGKVHSTKYRRPLVLVYYESYKSEHDARDREKKMKYYGKAYTQLKRKIARSIEEALRD